MSTNYTKCRFVFNLNLHQLSIQLGPPPYLKYGDVVDKLYKMPLCFQLKPSPIKHPAWSAPLSVTVAGIGQAFTKTNLLHFFLCVAGNLKDFGLNPKHQGAEIGMTMVLHTNSRSLNYHPHIHVIVPAGGIIRSRKQWKKKKGNYLFRQKNLSKVFRARFLAELNKCGLPIPTAPANGSSIAPGANRPWRSSGFGWNRDSHNIGKSLPFTMNTGGLTNFMKNVDDRHACSRPSHKYAQKKLRFSKNCIPSLLPKKIFPL
ncbi:transposase [Desulfosarcina ovata]|uniref:transposase n=1 Tax=Desulfosarcina ovata TaxID=83564 RepID=UPI0012D35B23|nr:transposase [Desulfosarcina ovata]